MAKTKRKPSAYDRYLGLEAFTEGRCLDAWRFFGAHPHVQNKQSGFQFRVWAPNAAKIAVFGPINDLNPSSH